jgi:regulatory protein
MRIISIEKAHRGGKFKISLEQGEEMLLSKEVIVDFGLRRNDEISQETFLKIQSSQSYHDTYVAAMRLLNYRMRTRHELAQRLRQKQFPSGIIVQVLEKLNRLGLIDDSRFAEAFIASKTSSRPIGKKLLEHRLQEKGVSKETALEAVAPLSDEATQLELALKAAKAKVRSIRKFDAIKRREKLIAFLARRGFDWAIIKKVVLRIIPEDDDSENGEFDAGDFQKE